MDKSAWKTDDPAWVKAREKQWEGLQSYLKRDRDFNHDGNPEEFMKQARDYFTGADIEYPDDYEKRLSAPNWQARVTMHPNPTVEVIRAIQLESLKKLDNKSAYGHYGQHYKIIQNRWAPLIKKGLLPESIVDTYLDAIYGNSFEEALQINQADLKAELNQAIENLLEHLFGWALGAANADCDYFPYERFWKQLEDMLLHVEDANFTKLGLDFLLKRLVRNINNFEDFWTAKLPRQRAFIEFFRKRIREIRGQLNPRFWPYIDALTD